MNNTSLVKLKGNAMLLLAAVVWGLAFVAQNEGMAYVGPFTFTAVRMALGALALLPLALFRLKKTTFNLARTLRGGLVCGAVLFVASMLQQTGLKYTTPGKSGFICALYLVGVPLVSFLRHRKLRISLWIAVFCSVIGLYLLSITDGFHMEKGDLITLLTVPCYTAHILLIDRYSDGTDGVLESCIQFAVTALLSTAGMFLFESPTPASIWDCRISILYAGVISCGVGYTMQVIGQKYTAPSDAALLLSLESVFSAVFSWLIQGNGFSLREFFGAVIMFCGVLLAQLPQLLPSKKGQVV